MIIRAVLPAALLSFATWAATAEATVYKVSFTTAGSPDLLQNGPAGFDMTGTSLQLPITGSFLLDVSYPPDVFAPGTAANYFGAMSDVRLSFGGVDLFVGPTGAGRVTVENGTDGPTHDAISFNALLIGSATYSVIPGGQHCVVQPSDFYVQLIEYGPADPISSDLAIPAPMTQDLFLNSGPAVSEFGVNFVSPNCRLFPREIGGPLASFEMTEEITPIPVPAAGVLLASLVGGLLAWRPRGRSRANRT